MNGTGDCHTCPHWRQMNSKFKGRRVPGGFGKCIRPDVGEPCVPERPRLGIGGVASGWRPKAARPGATEGDEGEP